MYLFMVIVHVLVSFIMVGVILLQSGKGAEIGAAFGGSSQTIFGSRGPGTFLSKMTAVAAAIFFVTSLGLSVLSKGRFLSSSVVDTTQKPAAEAEALPAATPEVGEAPAPVSPPAESPAEPPAPSP